MSRRAFALLAAALVLAGCGSATQQNEPTLPRLHPNSNQYPDDAR
jgi:ABC-type glycerol-3-phosphate transport system substrate-binding protein